MKINKKRYEIDEKATPEKLLEAGFKKGGWHTGIEPPKISYECVLFNEIYLQIEMHINEEGKLEFDDFDNVDVFDNQCIQSYLPFYEENKRLPYLQEVIKKYNKVMDSFVEKGIFKEKQNEIQKESKVKTK